MAVLRIPDENRTVQTESQVRDYLAQIGIDYERWELVPGMDAEASSEEILSAYNEQIAELKRRVGYVTADVIDVKPDTPGLDTMLAKFKIEHRHDEDEVRYIIAGPGI